ncbi:hypothetical protein E4U30_005338 [Claviceps sp. LM220 group G6]|nr:hypothetical protein E4U30_005338 [Claviceps sp. LM220 group G6]
MSTTRQTVCRYEAVADSARRPKRLEVTESRAANRRDTNGSGYGATTAHERMTNEGLDSQQGLLR